MVSKSSENSIDVHDWLDPETKSILFPSPADYLIATATQSYALLLLKWGRDRRRAAEVVAEIQRSVGWEQADLPFVIAQRMTLEDAMAGQLALVCCDCITAFVADEHVRDDNAQFLQRLFREVSASVEFELVPVRLDEVPDSEAGKRFCWQFLGNAMGFKLPATFEFYRKKVRLMEHWAERLGVRIEVEVGVMED